jgi:hypothetical protein
MAGLDGRLNASKVSTAHIYISQGIFGSQHEHASSREAGKVNSRPDLETPGLRAGLVREDAEELLLGGSRRHGAGVMG